MKRAPVLAMGGAVAYLAIAACSLHDLDYLTNGPGNPGEIDGSEGGGPSNPEGGGDGGNPTRSATVLADKQLAPRLLVQDVGALYWVTGDGSIMTIEKENGSAPRPVASIGPNATFLAADPASGGSLFYSLGKQVFSLAKTGGTPTSIATLSPAPNAIVIDDTNVFVSVTDPDATDNPAIYRMPRSGGAAVKIVDPGANATEIVAMAIDKDNLYWDQGDGAFYSLAKGVAPDAGAPRAYTANSQDVESASGPLAFAVDDTAFFYSDGLDVKSLARVDRATPTKLIPSSNDTQSVDAIAIDATYVYAADARANGTLQRNTKDGRGVPETMLANLATPNAVVADTRWVFVTVEGPPGQVLRVDK